MLSLSSSICERGGVRFILLLLWIVYGTLVRHSWSNLRQELQCPHPHRTLTPYLLSLLPHPYRRGLRLRGLASGGE